MTPLPPLNPSPRLSLLADLLQLPIHRSRGSPVSHVVYRASLRSFHRTLARLGVVHGYEEGGGTGGGDGGVIVRMAGLLVDDGGGWGGVIVEDETMSDNTSDKVIDVTTPEPERPKAQPVARSRSEARRLAIQSSDGIDQWPNYLDPKMVHLKPKGDEA